MRPPSFQLPLLIRKTYEAQLRWAKGSRFPLVRLPRGSYNSPRHARGRYGDFYPQRHHQVRTGIYGQGTGRRSCLHCP